MEKVTERPQTLAEREAEIQHGEVDLEAKRKDLSAAEQAEEDAQRKKDLAAIDTTAAGRKKQIQETLAEVGRRFAALVPAWNALVEIPEGARLLHQLAGYTFDPSKAQAHCLAGTSLRGTAAPIGAQEEALIARLVETELAAQLAELEERASISRAAV